METAKLSFAELREQAIALRRAGESRTEPGQRRSNELQREATRASAAAEIGTITDRELVIAGAVAYWCEGAKNKPHRREDRVSFINSDPLLIRFFLHFLDVAGIPQDRLIFRVHIHENADVVAAQRFWLAVTGAREEQFRRPTLKRHSPKTVRPDPGVGYHGCLCIVVRRSGELYRRIEGWARAAIAPEPTVASER